MHEANSNDTAASAPEAGATVAPESGELTSIGAYLARQRQLRGISLEELAEITRIPLRSLQRLESGSFDSQVDGFVRGFVRTVATALGLDLDDTLTRMLQEPSSERAPRGRPGPALLRGLALALVVAVCVVGVGLVRAALEPGESEAPQDGSVVQRRDPVRILAEESLAAEREAAAAHEGPGPAEAGALEAVAAGPPPPGE
jgi:cytoskeletal protein RodZ